MNHVTSIFNCVTLKVQIDLTLNQILKAKKYGIEISPHLIPHMGFNYFHKTFLHYPLSFAEKLIQHQIKHHKFSTLIVQLTNIVSRFHSQ